MAQRLADRLLWGMLIALFLLGGMQLAANHIEPPNPGMANDPCPAPESRLRGMVRTGFLTLAGRPAELRDWPDLCVHQRDNAALAATGKHPHTVFIGDSVTQYWGRHDPAFFAPGIVNRGVAGQTSPQVLVRFTADALALKPRIIHVLVGLNDITGARGPSRPEDYRNNLRAMVVLARAEHVRLILGAVPPARAEGWANGTSPTARIRATNHWLQTLAEREGLIFADYWTAMAADDGTMRKELADDGVHPNAAGYAVMAKVARAALAEAARHPAPQ